LLEEEASWADGPFFTRRAPAVVETFQTSCINNQYFNNKSVKILVVETG
jgi:hypothetical protein